jgi:hypothetical protein
VRVAGVVEQVLIKRRKLANGEDDIGKSGITLPLKDHTLEFVVEDEDLDANTELGGCGELHSSHAEGGITVDVDDRLLRSCYLGTNGSRKTETHGL